MAIVERSLVLISTAFAATIGCAKPAASTTPVAPSGNPVQDVNAEMALTGVPMHMSPDQLPAQFRTQLREDVKGSKGIAVLHQNGTDLEYTFSWEGLTSPVISAHFHQAPHGQVGIRAFSICGVANESPACPTGTRASISGVWKNADFEAFRTGNVTIAFHTEVYPAPIGELAVYIPASPAAVASKP
jgi:hypothetical protein